MKDSLPLLQLCADQGVDKSMSSSTSISSFLTRGGSVNTSSLAAEVLLEQIAEQDLEGGRMLSSVIGTTSTTVFCTETESIACGWGGTMDKNMT